MRRLVLLVQLVPLAFLVACDQQPAAPDIDPALGRACFESHGLPPGTQYEGIEKHGGGKLTIRIMNGVDVSMLDCPLKPDGTLEGVGQ